MPITTSPPGAQFVFCLAYNPATGHHEVFDQLDARFATVPAGTYDPAEHLGAPATAFSS
ncbi:hypothetical protein [Streptomyces sp. NPDC097981]|uniref:hypothetical protein n=1 Tax=Streptomyces sp. NPDC097981 TaxID=3155428 RepID=UPI00332DA392